MTAVRSDVAARLVRKYYQIEQEAAEKVAASDFVGAIERYSSAIAAEPRARLYCKRGSAQLKLWRQQLRSLELPQLPAESMLELAILDFEAAFERDESNGRPALLKSIALIYLFRWPESLQTLKRAAGASKPSVNIQAKAFLAAMLDKDTRMPEQPQERRGILARIGKLAGNTLYADGDFAFALKHYKLAIDFNPKDAILFTNLAASYYEVSRLYSLRPNNNNDDSKEDSDEEEASSPSSEEAEEDESSPMEDDVSPSLPTSLHRETRRKVRLFHLRRALESADTAISLDSNYNKAHWRRGQALLALDRTDEALVSLEKAQSLGSIKQIERDLKITRALISRRKSHIPGYKSLVLPRQSQVWALPENPKFKQLLKHPDFRDALRQISENPSSLPEIFKKDPSIRTALELLLTDIDPRFKPSVP